MAGESAVLIFISLNLLVFILLHLNYTLTISEFIRTKKTLEDCPGHHCFGHYRGISLLNQFTGQSFCYAGAHPDQGLG